MIDFLLLAGMEWTDRHQGLVALAAALMCCVALAFDSMVLP